MNQTRIWLFLFLYAPLCGQIPAAPHLQPRAAPVYSSDIQLIAFREGNARGVVLWNGRPLLTQSAFGQLTAIVPAANLQSLGYSEVAVYDLTTGVTSPPAYFFTYVPLTSNEIVSDPIRELIYCSIPSTAPRYGNSIVAVNPKTGEILTNVFVGSEPNQMALSDDGQYLYVALEGASAIRRLNLATFQAELQFPLDQGQTPNLIRGFPLFAGDIKVVPGAPNSIIVSRFGGVSPDNASTAVYDNGVIRPKVTASYPGNRKIAFGGSASVLWGLLNNNGGMQRLTLESAGITITSGLEFTPDITGPVGTDFKFDDGRYYLDGGAVVDPNQKVIVGKFAASGAVQPDSSLGRIFFLGRALDGTPALQTFDLNTFAPLGSLPVLDLLGPRLLRWGSNGVAMSGSPSEFIDSNNVGKVYIFRTPMADTPPSITPGAIVNAASGRPGPISPGEILSIFGANLGPAAGRGLQLDRVGHVASMLANIQVLFDSTPGTLTYVGASQINVIAPYSIARQSALNVVVTNTGIPSAPVRVQVAAASPAVFSANGSGSGPGAILNQDGTLNSASNPAEADSVITLFGTGEGLTSPTSADGNITTGPPPAPVTPLTATIDGRAASVVFAGKAPQLVSGVFQMNIRIPADAHPGAAIPVVVQSGDISSPPVTVAVK